MTAYRTVDGDSVDLIVWRIYGATPGIVEQLLELNPGLAALGPALPAGLELVLPPTPATADSRTVRVWD